MDLDFVLITQKLCSAEVDLLSDPADVAFRQTQLPHGKCQDPSRLIPREASRPEDGEDVQGNSPVYSPVLAQQPHGVWSHV